MVNFQIKENYWWRNQFIFSMLHEKRESFICIFSKVGVQRYFKDFLNFFVFFNSNLIKPDLESEFLQSIKVCTYKTFLKICYIRPTSEFFFALLYK